MIRFFDASALVKRYITEPESLAVRDLLAGDLPAVSRISEVEVASALARRCREGHFPASERDRAIATLREDIRSLLIVELTTEVVAVAYGLLTRHRLRDGDAIQLASSLELRQRLRYPMSFVAFDEKLCAAARDEGMEVLEVTATEG